VACAKRCKPCSLDNWILQEARTKRNEEKGCDATVFANAQDVLGFAGGVKMLLPFGVTWLSFWSR
jgi:hypothetical protein